MQMRSVGAAGHADRADQIALLHPLPLFDVNLVHVDVDRIKAKPMIDHDGLAGQHHAVMNQTDNAVRRRDDGCANWRGDVEPRMR